MYIYFTDSLHVFVYETHAKPFQRLFYSANHVKQIEQEIVFKKKRKTQNQKPPLLITQKRQKVGKWTMPNYHFIFLGFRHFCVCSFI